MDDVLAATLPRGGGWWPNEYKILFRANMDGSDAIDRRREKESEELEQWGALIGDSWYSWFCGCSFVGTVAQGCDGECPLCTGNHYESEEDRIPLTFWID